MAEIKIEKKKPIWPWILLVLILILAAILYFMYGNEVDDDSDLDDVATELDETHQDDSNEMENTVSYEDSLNSENYNSALKAYNLSVQDTIQLGMDQVITSTALMNLAKAIEAKATQLNLENSGPLERLETDVKSVDSTLTASGNKIDTKTFKTTGIGILAAMDHIQKEQFPDLLDDVSEVKNSLNKISPQELLTNQTQAVNSFFRESNEVLNQMNTNIKYQSYE